MEEQPGTYIFTWGMMRIVCIVILRLLACCGLIWCDIPFYGILWRKSEIKASFFFNPKGLLVQMDGLMIMDEHNAA